MHSNAFSPMNAVQKSTNPLLLSVNNKSIDQNQIVKLNLRPGILVSNLIADGRKEQALCTEIVFLI